MDDVSDKFAPLTDEERAAAGPKAAADDEWTVVTPVPAPANSLPPDVLWKFEGTWKEPDATWPYRGGDGRLLGYACRWDIPPECDGELPDKEFSFAACARARFATQEGGGLNFFGPSSTGKTTLLQAAASV